MAKNILSIDIGTSSVKISLIEIRSIDSYEILSQSKCFYDIDSIRSKNLPKNYSQQNVRIIFETIINTLNKFNNDSNQQIDSITVCGQMHSCVLWNHQLFNVDPFDFNNLNYDLISDNYDWTDLRCDGKFLQTLPKPNCFADKISSGFGCATLFWLSRFQSDYLERFDRCGTIMDLFVCVLCRLADHVPISVQNAHAWGYFDPITCSWNTDILEQAGFPVRLLPKPIKSIEIVGHTRFDWNHSMMKSGIPVFVALGDLQSMIYLVLKNDPNAIVLNMGTSAQICCLHEIENQIPRKSELSVQSYDYYPYYCKNSNEYLLVAPSLNGGNVLLAFMNFIQSTIKYMTDIEMTTEEMWKKFNEHQQHTTANDIDDSILIKPTLYGERHDLHSLFSVYILNNGQHITIFNVFKCLCIELIQNVFEMMPMVVRKINENFFIKKLRTKLICTGSVIANNSLMKQSLIIVLERILSNYNHNKNNGNDNENLIKSLIDIEFINDCDADVGCALFVYNKAFIH